MDSYAYRKHKKAFADTFGKPLYEFWDRETGFDVALFDDTIIHSGNSLMLEKVRNRFGDPAGDMIKELTLA